MQQQQQQGFQGQQGCFQGHIGQVGRWVAGGAQTVPVPVSTVIDYDCSFHCFGGIIHLQYPHMTRPLLLI